MPESPRSPHEPAPGPPGGASELRFAALTESLPIICWSATADGAVDYANARWVEYTGFSPADAIGWTWTGAVHPDDLPALGELWTNALAAGAPIHTEYRLRGKGGGYRWFEVRASPVIGPGGEIARWYGTCADVHEAYELRRELAEREAQLTAALEAGAMARFSYDLEARRFTADPYLGAIISLPREMRADAGLDGFLQFVHPDDRAHWQSTMMRAFDPATPEWAMEYRLASREAVPTWIGARGRVEFGAGGKPRKILGIIYALPGRGAPPDADHAPMTAAAPPIGRRTPRGG